jgi:hypothetical protein
MKYFPANYRLATSVLLLRNSEQVIEPVMCCMFFTDKDDLPRFFSIKISRRNKQVTYVVVSHVGVNETYVACNKKTKKELCLEGRKVKISSNAWIWLFVSPF